LVLGSESLSHRLCDRLGPDRARLLDYFLLYIVVRYRQFLSVWSENHYSVSLSQHLYGQYYQLLLKNETQCCFWKSQASGLR